MNTLGGHIGVIIYAVLFIIIKKRDKTQKFINVLATIGTALIIAFMAFIIIVNL